MHFTSYIYQDTLKTLDLIWWKLASGGEQQMLQLEEEGTFDWYKIWWGGCTFGLCTCMWFLGVRLDPQKHQKVARLSKWLNLIHPGHGVPLKDVPPEKFSSTAMPKSYQALREKVADVDLALTYCSPRPISASIRPTSVQKQVGHSSSRTQEALAAH